MEKYWGERKKRNRSFGKGKKEKKGGNSFFFYRDGDGSNSPRIFVFYQKIPLFLLLPFLPS